MLSISNPSARTAWSAIHSTTRRYRWPVEETHSLRTRLIALILPRCPRDRLIVGLSMRSHSIFMANCPANKTVNLQTSSQRRDQPTSRRENWTSTTTSLVCRSQKTSTTTKDTSHPRKSRSSSRSDTASKRTSTRTSRVPSIKKCNQSSFWTKTAWKRTDC